MDLELIGVSSRVAPLEARERFSLDRAQAAALLRALRAEKAADEALVLSTCNRTEVILTGAKDCSAQKICARIGEIKVAAAPDAALLYRFCNNDAARHLFRVAAALDSQMIGEREILGQVKDAYRLTVECGTGGPFLHRLLHQASRVGRRVASETELSRGAVGIPGAAAELARRHLRRLSGRAVLLIGAGQTIEAAARGLLGAGVARVFIANRTARNAQHLADALRRPPKGKSSRCARDLIIEQVSLDRAAEYINHVEVILSATRAPGHILSYEQIAGTMSAAKRHLLIVDMAVPRDVDPRIGELQGVRLYNLDDFKQLVEENRQRRRKEIPRAEEIVAQEAERFELWLRAREVAPTIRHLRERLEEISAAELRDHVARFSVENRDELEKFARHLARRLMHQPIAYLRESSGRNDAHAAEAVRRVFGLEQRETPE